MQRCSEKTAALHVFWPPQAQLMKNIKLLVQAGALLSRRLALHLQHMFQESNKYNSAGDTILILRQKGQLCNCLHHTSQVGELLAAEGIAPALSPLVSKPRRSSSANALVLPA